MHTSKPKLTEEVKHKVLDKLFYSARDVSSYSEIFTQYELTNEQIDELLSSVGVGVTSAVEAKTAESVTAFLNSMKK